MPEQPAGLDLLDITIVMIEQEVQCNDSESNIGEAFRDNQCKDPRRGVMPEDRG